MTIRAIGKQGITPTVVLNSVAEDLPNFEDLYVVGFNSKGEPTIYASGNLGRLGLAVIVLQDQAIKILNDAVEGT